VCVYECARECEGVSMCVYACECVSECVRVTVCVCVRTIFFQLKDCSAVYIYIYIYIYIFIYLTTIGLTPGGISAVHIYTQTIHRIQGMEHT
jgi:hypothetical protein